MDLDDDFDELSAGRAVKRDGDGKFTGAKLDPAVAAQMGRNKHAAADAAAQMVDDLLVQMGYDDPATAPASDRLLARQAAAAKGAGSVTALTVLLRQAGQLVREARTHKEWSGVGACPTCGRSSDALVLADDAVKQIAEAMSGALDYDDRLAAIKAAIARGEKVELEFY